MSGFITKKLDSRRSLGSILKTARRRHSLTLEQAESQTKIPLKYLQALEEGEYSELPAEAYNIGYARRYAEFLHLAPEKILRLYREERSDKWHQAASRVAFAPKKVGDWQFLITPKLLTAMGMVILFGGLVAYIIGQLREFTQPPELLISSVPAEFTSDRDLVTIAGKTSGGSSVSINTEPIFVSPEGEFAEQVQLSPGVNEIVISAKNRAEKASRQIVKVLYNPDLASSVPAAKTE